MNGITFDISENTKYNFFALFLCAIFLLFIGIPITVQALFMTEERERQKEEYPLLSCNDIELLLRTYLPRRDIEYDEVLRQMEKRHLRRKAAIDLAFNKQQMLSTS